MVASYPGERIAVDGEVTDCRNLLKLYEDDHRTSAEVKQIAEGHLAEIDQKITELTEMRATLSRLVDACAGDHRPDCLILADLATAADGIALADDQG